MRCRRRRSRRPRAPVGYPGAPGILVEVLDALEVEVVLDVEHGRGERPLAVASSLPLALALQLERLAVAAFRVSVGGGFGGLACVGKGFHLDGLSFAPLARACARYGRMWEEKEEEFLKSYIEDSFRPCFKGVREFGVFKIVQDCSRLFKRSPGVFGRQVP